MTPPEPQTGTSPERQGDLSSGILPPLDETQPQTPPLIPRQGVSPALRRTIILFTVFTFLAFAVFGIFFVKSLLHFQKEKNVWDDEALTVARRLQEAGLYDQALRQYERYLENPAIDFQTRGRVAYETAGLYLELDNCAEGLVWLYHAQTAYPQAPWAKDLEQKIDACLVRRAGPRQ